MGAGKSQNGGFKIHQKSVSEICPEITRIGKFYLHHWIGLRKGYKYVSGVGVVALTVPEVPLGGKVRPVSVCEFSRYKKSQDRLFEGGPLMS